MLVFFFIFEYNKIKQGAVAAFEKGEKHMNNFGNKIRELRKKKGITQEQLASALNISPQAVSKWEMSAGYPDVSLIPILAGYFEVSLDVLFDYDASQIKQKVEDILDEASRYFWGNFAKAEEIYLRGIESYPGALKLKNELLTLYECHMRNFGSMELADKAVALAEKILSETDDWFILTNTKDSLASIYKMCGRYEEAKKVVHSMPVLWPMQINDRMRSAAFILEGRDRLEGTSDLKPYLHQDLFAICDHEGQGYFEIGEYENALKSFRESAAVIELFLKDRKITPDAYPIPGTESNHCHTVVAAAACLYKLGRLEECEEELKKAYRIVVDSHDAEELAADPDCFLAYRESYHKHGLDEYKPCI